MDGFGGRQVHSGFHDSLRAYGGTTHSSAVVFACTTLIADTLAGYPWAITSKRDKPIARNGRNRDLFELLEQPSEGNTYGDFVADMETDLCLVGNSWWLKDQQNLLGRPTVLSRMDPSTVKVKTNKRDQKIGYTVRIDSVEIPFGLNDIIHFRTRNPMNKHYGMGIVEAMFREMTQDVAQAGHLTAFFQNGARIAGVLTVPESMDDVQYARLKREIEEEYGDPRNAYGLVLAEKATNFTPVTAPLQHLQIVDLSKLTDDSILMGFGVPKFMLGGYEEGGMPKMGEVQHIFNRRMMTRAARFQARTTLDLVSRWDGNKFAVYFEPNEPPAVKIENAQGLAKAGASLNETRGAAGLPLIDNEQADIPLVPNTVTPLKLLFQKPPARPTLPRGPDDKPDEGNDDDDKGYGAEVVVFEGVYAPRPAREIGHRGAPTPIGGVALELEAGASSHEAGGTATAVVDGGLAEQVDDVIDLIECPVLPPGYEPRAAMFDPGSIDSARVQTLLIGQADFFVEATSQIQVAFIDFFNKQRMRIATRLASGDFRSNAGRAKSRSRGGAQAEKRELTADELWERLEETTELIQAYLTVIDSLGPKAIEVPAQALDISLSWDTADTNVSAARDRLGARIIGVNEITRQAVTTQVEEGMRRGYTLQQIQFGTQENYLGIQGVFNDATVQRAEAIARSESAMIYNGAISVVTRAVGWCGVGIIDGTGDEACTAANGAIWPIDQFEVNSIGQTDCARMGVPMSPEEVDANGGYDL